MQAKMKVCAVTAAAFLAFVFALMPQASAAGSVTLTPTAQAPGATVSISGTGFSAAKNVAIVFGGELKAVNEGFMPIITGPNSRDYNFTHGPIKPGSFHMRVGVADLGTFSEYSVDGQCNIVNDATGASFGTMDYALGGFIHPSTGTPSMYEWYASYTYYQYNVTTYGRVTTTGSGTFSANFTVPAVANGNYNVTAIESDGISAMATLNVNSAIPEGLPFGSTLLLSSAAVAVGSWRLRKRPKIKN